MYRMVRLLLALAIVATSAGAPAQERLRAESEAFLVERVVRPSIEFARRSQHADGWWPDRLERRGDDWVPFPVMAPANGAYVSEGMMAAHRLGMMEREEVVARMRRFLVHLGRIRRDAKTGLFFQFYDEAGEPLRSWPAGNTPVQPILSSVDNGLLAMTLHRIANDYPELRAHARQVVERMDFAAVWDGRSREVRGGLLSDGKPTSWNYGNPVTDGRAAAYAAMLNGQLAPGDAFVHRAPRGQDGVMQSFNGTLWEALAVALLAGELGDADTRAALQRYVEASYAESPGISYASAPRGQGCGCKGGYPEGGAKRCRVFGGQPEQHAGLRATNGLLLALPFLPRASVAELRRYPASGLTAMGPVDSMCRHGKVAASISAQTAFAAPLGYEAYLRGGARPLTAVRWSP